MNRLTFTARVAHGLRQAALALGLAGLVPQALALSPADLGWDLTYQGLWPAAAPADADDGLGRWLAQHPQRFIHEQLQALPKRTRIRASVLIEAPGQGSRQDGAQTFWLIRTTDGAQRCTERRRAGTPPCEPFNADDADALIQELAALPAWVPQGDSDGRTPLALISTYVNGRASQRVLTHAEFKGPGLAAGRPDDLSPWPRWMAMLSLSDAERQAHKAALLAQQQEATFQRAVSQGDVNTVRALLDAQAKAHPAVATSNAQEALARAITLKQNTLLAPLAGYGVDFSQVGAKLLRVAVHSQNAQAVTWLVQAQRVPLNQLTPRCESVFLLAEQQQLADMVQLLTQLGAQADWHHRCARLVRKGHQNSETDEDAVLAQAYAKRLREKLDKKQFTELNAWHAQLTQSQERTASGLWKLSIYHTQLTQWFVSTKDPAYWQRMESLWKAWLGAEPKASSAARLFGVLMGQQKAWAYRGNTIARDVPPADMTMYREAGSLADHRLLVDMQLTSRPRGSDLRGQPEAYQLMVEFARFTDCGTCARFRRTPELWDRVDTTVPSSLQGHPDRNPVLWAARMAMAKFPTYHPAFFSAAHFLRPEWWGSFAMIDDMAREATRASAATEGQAMYARIHWSLSEAFPGALFQRTKASWPDMKAGFEDMVKQFPAKRNLNAYASFACEAGDLTTMRQVLDRIGDEVMFSVWRGADRFFECAQR